MAKIYNVLRYVDDIKPNRFTDDTKVQWLNEVEGYIQTEVMMLALADVVQYDPEAHMHTDLLVKPPHDKLYALYLCAMIDFANGEYDKYANTMQLYNEFLGEYIGWYTLHFRPADGGCVREGYYLSAYAIAVAVNGFEGTEKEWLEHLKGAPGRSAYEDAVAHGYTGTEEEFGRDQASFAENATAVRQMREQVEAAASFAAGSAENARQSANNASSDANAAETAATEAAKSASDAKESAQNAVREVSSAADQALRDIESAGNEKIGEIESAAGEAEAAAARAKSSASSASSASMSAMDYSNQASRHSATASVYAGQARTSASNAETSANNAAASKDAAETASAEAKSAAERVKDALGLYPTITLTPLTVAPGMPNAFRVTVKNADGTIMSETVENGVNGITPHIGHNGNWWIGSADTGVLARGVAPTISVDRDDNEGRVDIFVEDGKGGAKFVWVNDGKPGVNGITPHIGTNGNWYIGDTDTGVFAGGGSGGGISRETDPTVPDWAKQPEKPAYTADEVGALPVGTKIPSKTSDIVNDSGFITRLVADLANYYAKSETYTRTEINALVSAIPKFGISVVNALPTSGISKTTVYLVKSGSGADLYTEYIFIVDDNAPNDGRGTYDESGGAWEILGSQKVDLAGYATEAWVNTKLADYLPAAQLQTAINTALAQAKASGEFDGADGNPGFSPTVSVSAITGGHRITITDKTGTKTADVMDGTDGDPGAPGKNGNPGRGITSVVRTSGTGAAGTTDTYTITYTDNTTSTFAVYNGKDGTPYALTSADKTAIAREAAGLVEVPDVDNTLKVSGAAADAAKVGTELSNLSEAIADQQTAIDGKQPKGNYALKTELAAETTAREQAIADLNARLGQQNLLIAEGETMEEALAWLESNGDKTRAYLMPDDFFYAWRQSTEVGGIAYTNLLPLSTTAVGGTTIYGGDYNGDGTPDGYKTNTKLSGSGGGESSAGSGKEAMCSSGFIFPVVAGDLLRIKGITPVTGSNHYVVGYDAAGTRTGNDTLVFEQSADGSLVWVTGSGTSGKYTMDDDGTIVYTINTAKLGANVYAVRVCAAMGENTIITLNQEIKEGGGTVIVEKWASTGHSLVQSDCSAEFARLITVTDTHTAEINGLKTAVEGRSPLTEEEKLERIKEWDAPIYDANVPVFTLSAEKAAVTTAEKTVSAVYAKYDALMARHPHYITKTNLGMCSDGVTPVYRYDFREPEPHRGVTGAKEWSETKSKAIIVSGIHWEWGGIFALYNALEEIADNPNLYNLRRNTHLIVLPVCNPYAVANMSVRNANLIEIHRNFEVDFIYPGEPGYIELGERSHGGTEPLSEVETQYIDNILRDNTDAALFLTCHSNQSDTVYGTGFTWASPATYYMCNMHYRIVDKLSAVWMDKYGNELAAGIADYRTENTPEWDNRLGSAYLSTTNGTETKQATKYGIQATNIEITDAFLVHGTKANPEPALSSFTMSRGAEVYANFLLTAFGVYRYTDKEAYYK